MMATAITLALLGLLHSVQASDSTECSLSTIAPSKNLTWCPCEQWFFCARLDVPLDYQNPELGRASIPLMKYPASTSGPYQGMILLNPGGPGGSGIDEVREYGPGTLPLIFGDNWDFVGFDPRGMWLSEPMINCSAKTWARASGAALESGSVTNVTDDYYDSFMRYGADLGSDCAVQSGGELDAGPYMSTAINARDMLSIVDAFAATEDGKRAAKPNHLLNFYGISYGTVLGQTFASMFPQRVGNMVLDAVVDPEDYVVSMTRKNINHLDGVIAAFFIYCHEAGPSLCPYYTGSSAKDISDRLHRSFALLDSEKAREENWSNATEIESALMFLKSGLMGAAYAPSGGYDVLADALLHLERAISDQQLSPWIQSAREFFTDPYPSGIDFAPFIYGVLCSDQNNRWFNKTLQDYMPLVAEVQRQSIIGDLWVVNPMVCSGWSIKAAETFTGPFTGNTATPILFVGNTYDPVASFDNAVSSAQNYKGAQSLIIDGLGHAMFDTQNLCAVTKVGKYFQTGEMPGNDSFCPFESRAFGGIMSLNGTLKESIIQAGLSNVFR